MAAPAEELGEPCGATTSLGGGCSDSRGDRKFGIVDWSVPLNLREVNGHFGICGAHRVGNHDTAGFAIVLDESGGGVLTGGILRGFFLAGFEARRGVKIEANDGARIGSSFEDVERFCSVRFGSDEAQVRVAFAEVKIAVEIGFGLCGCERVAGESLQAVLRVEGPASFIVASCGEDCFARVREFQHDTRGRLLRHLKTSEQNLAL